MHVLLGAIGVSDERVDQMEAALRALAPGAVEVLVGRSGTGCWLAVTPPTSPVTAHTRDHAVGLAAIGSGAPAASAGGGLAAELRSPGRVLAASVPEVAAVRIDGDACSLLAAAGPGNQGLFVGEPADGGTIVGSNLHLVATCTGTSGQIDRSAEDVLLGFGFLPDDRTVHPRVRALRGTTLQIGPTPAGPTFTPAPAAVPEVSSFDEAVDVLFELYMGVLEEQAGRGSAHAVLLGGFDSALVAASLRHLGHDVATYTFGFGDATYEQRNVGLVTATIGSDEHWVRITPEVIADGLAEFGRVFAQPGPQPHYQLHTLAATRQVRADGFERVFTGDGCGTQSSGVPDHEKPRSPAPGRFAATPEPLQRRCTAADVDEAGRPLPGPHSRACRAALLEDVPLGRRRVDACRTGASTTSLCGAYVPDPLRLRTRPSPRSDAGGGRCRRLGSDAARVHGNALAGQSRMKVHGTVGDTGVAQFTPFTHPRVSRFVSSLPVEFLRPTGTSARASGKALLIEMVRRNRLLPGPLIDMPKQSPSDSPIDAWYSGPLRSLVFQSLVDLPFDWDRSYVEEILRPRTIEDVYRRRVSLGHQAHQAIGLLLSYAAFARG